MGIVRHTVVFAYASKQLLLEELLDWNGMSGIISKGEVRSINQIEGWFPLYSLDVCRACVKKAFEGKPMEPLIFTQVNSLENAIASLWLCLGGCLRIRYTPIPPVLEGYMIDITLFYLIIVPFALVNDLEWWVLLVSGVMAWYMFGIQTAAWEIQNPFGKDISQLPLDAYCQRIQVECINTFHRLHVQFDESLFLGRPHVAI